jgi:hypothetical protein
MMVDYTSTGTPAAAPVTVVPVVATGDLLTDLKAARANCVNLLLQITASPQPSYNVHSHSFSWSEYHDMLVREIETLGRLITQQEPTEVVSQGIL